MKTKPVFPLLVSMALPNVISMLVNSLYNIVDSLFVAQINEQAMTALSLVFPIQNFVNAVAIGFGIGVNALVALYRGAGDHDRADAAATHGMALSMLHGILCTLAATAIMPGFLARFTADGTKISVRPSGTEPKIKFYIEVKGQMATAADYDKAQAEALVKIDSIKADLGL